MLTRYASTASRLSAVYNPLFKMQLLRLMSCMQVEHEPSVPTLEALLLSCIAFAAQHNLAAVTAGSSTLHHNHTLLLHAAAAAVAVVLELLVSQQRQPSLWMQAQLQRTHFVVVWNRCTHADPDKRIWLLRCWCGRCCCCCSLCLLLQERAPANSWCLLGVVLSIAGCCSSHLLSMELQSRHRG